MTDSLQLINEAHMPPLTRVRIFCKVCCGLLRLRCSLVVTGSVHLQVEARLNLEEGEDAAAALSLAEEVYGPFSGQVASDTPAIHTINCS